MEPLDAGEWHQIAVDGRHLKFDSGPPYWSSVFRRQTGLCVGYIVSLILVLVQLHPDAGGGARLIELATFVFHRPSRMLDPEYTGLGCFVVFLLATLLHGIVRSSVPRFPVGFALVVATLLPALSNPASCAFFPWEHGRQLTSEPGHSLLGVGRFLVFWGLVFALPVVLPAAKRMASLARDNACIENVLLGLDVGQIPRQPRLGQAALTLLMVQRVRELVNPSLLFNITPGRTGVLEDLRALGKQRRAPVDRGTEWAAPILRNAILGATLDAVVFGTLAVGQRPTIWVLPALALSAGVIVYSRFTRGAVPSHAAAHLAFCVLLVVPFGNVTAIY